MHECISYNTWLSGSQQDASSARQGFHGKVSQSDFNIGEILLRIRFGKHERNNDYNPQHVVRVETGKKLHGMWLMRMFSKPSKVNPFSPDGAKSNIDKLSKIANWVELKHKQNHSKVLLKSFPMNDHTLGFCMSMKEELENFVSAKVSVW